MTSQRERKLWIELQQQIQDTVNITAASGKPYDGLNARTGVQQRVNEACNMLKQIILGGVVYKQSYNMPAGNAQGAPGSVYGNESLDTGAKLEE